MIITTNNHPREWMYRSDVPDKVLADRFDWLDPDNEYGFTKYQGTWYHVSEFMRFGYPQSGVNEYGYHAYLNDSMSSGILIKLIDQDDTFIIASYRS
jgi:hypothetical protein